MVIARSVRGMNDLFEPELSLYKKIEYTISTIGNTYNFREIRTPILEELQLFKRSIGEATDIVEKEMFVLHDNEHTYCLRPENTASVVRALIERGGLSKDSIEKLFYLGPMFRKERPQKGRFRQFHQFGLETFGVSEPIAEIEIIVLVSQFLESIGLTNISLKINSLGTTKERLKYKECLIDFLSTQAKNLCSDCNRRLTINPLRVLDCKNESCKALIKKAPTPRETLSSESRNHFAAVCEGLKVNAISFQIDDHLVRGLDYYERTVFEFVAQTGLGAQNAVVAGGRYDGLFKTLGNKFDLPAVGCAGGIERLVLLLSEHNNKILKPKIDICLIGADEEGVLKTQSLAFSLRKLNIITDFSLTKKSLKAQMRRADKLNAQFVAVIGSNEINENAVKLKSLTKDFEKEIKLNAFDIADFLNAKIN